MINCLNFNIINSVNNNVQNILEDIIASGIQEHLCAINEIHEEVLPDCPCFFANCGEECNVIPPFDCTTCSSDVTLCAANADCVTNNCCPSCAELNCPDKPNTCSANIECRILGCCCAVCPIHADSCFGNDNCVLDGPACCCSKCSVADCTGSTSSTNDCIDHGCCL